MLSNNLRFIFIQLDALSRMFHEWPTATVDMAVLPGVLGCCFDRLTLRRTVQVRLGSNPAVPRDGCQGWHPHLIRARSAQSRKRVPSFTVSRHQFMKHPGYSIQVSSQVAPQSKTMYWPAQNSAHGFFIVENTWRNIIINFLCNLYGIPACPAGVSVTGTTFRTRQCFVPFRVVLYIPPIP